ncbi:MAG: ketol-acid reductoisomerase [Deltaproteobacteria bacterium]|nr:ketol-acid reductoisomerase [Deltaproteobacteria bacterium]MBI3016782.1 ketol-acid reductoisomerase [Deltaproteobacteria bacterium]
MKMRQNQNILLNKRIAVLGYGSQGRAQALNLKESGCDVVVGLRPGSPSFKKAKKDKILALPIAQALEGADLICFLLPDEFQASVYQKVVGPILKKGMTLVFAHGFSIFFKLIKPPSFVDIILIAPKMPGGQFRKAYISGEDVMACVAIHQNTSGKVQHLALAYSKAIGCSTVLKTTFQEETISNLFGEQTVKCGGVLDLMKASYETLVQAGVSSELAYLECVQGFKCMMDLLVENGFEGMQKLISPIASYGGQSRGPRLINKTVKDELKNILKEIQSGQFATEWLKKSQSVNARVIRKDLRN